MIILILLLGFILLAVYFSVLTKVTANVQSSSKKTLIAVLLGVAFLFIAVIVGSAMAGFITGLSSSSRKCSRCNGLGKFYISDNSWIECPECNGTGYATISDIYKSPIAVIHKQIKKGTQICVPFFLLFYLN